LMNSSSKSFSVCPLDNWSAVGTCPHMWGICPGRPNNQFQKLWSSLSTMSHMDRSLAQAKPSILGNWLLHNLNSKFILGHVLNLLFHVHNPWFGLTAHHLLLNSTHQSPVF
jgi:hypothetical protein